jgi:hypothetical protein
MWAKWVRLGAASTGTRKQWAEAAGASDSKLKLYPLADTIREAHDQLATQHEDENFIRNSLFSVFDASEMLDDSLGLTVKMQAHTHT